MLHSTHFEKHKVRATRQLSYDVIPTVMRVGPEVVGRLKPVLGIRTDLWRKQILS